MSSKYQRDKVAIATIVLSIAMLLTLTHPVYAAVPSAATPTVDFVSFSATPSITSYTGTTTTFDVPIIFNVSGDEDLGDGVTGIKTGNNSVTIGFLLNAGILYDSTQVKPVRINIEQVNLGNVADANNVNYHSPPTSLDVSARVADLQAQTGSVYDAFNTLVADYGTPATAFAPFSAAPALIYRAVEVFGETVQIPNDPNAGVDIVRHYFGSRPSTERDVLQYSDWAFGRLGASTNVFNVNRLIGNFDPASAGKLDDPSVLFCEDIAFVPVANLNAAGNENQMYLDLVQAALDGTATPTDFNNAVDRFAGFDRCAGYSLSYAGVYSSVDGAGRDQSTIANGAHPVGTIVFEVLAGAAGDISVQVDGNWWEPSFGEEKAGTSFPASRPAAAVISDGKPPVVTVQSDLADQDSGNGVTTQNFRVTSNEDVSIEMRCTHATDGTVTATLNPATLTGGVATTVDVATGLTPGADYTACQLRATDGGSNVGTGDLGDFQYADTTNPNIASVNAERTGANDLALDDTYAHEDDTITVTINFDEPVVCVTKPVIKIGTVAVAPTDITQTGTAPADQDCDGSSATGDTPAASAPMSAVYTFDVPDEATGASGEVIVEMKEYEDRSNNVAGTSTAVAVADTLYTKGAAADSGKVAVETTDPTATIADIAPANGKTAANSLRPSLSTTSAVAAGHRIYIHESGNALGTGAVGAQTLTLTNPLNEGSNTVEVSVIDNFGNRGPDTALGVTVDTVDPVFSVAPSQIARGNDATPDFTFTATDTGSATLTFSVAGTGCASSTAATVTSGTQKTVTLDALTHGTYSDCTVTVEDAGGNTVRADIPSFEVDLEGPTVNVIRVAGNSNAASDAEFISTATGSDLVANTYKYKDMAASACDDATDFATEPTSSTAYTPGTQIPKGTNGICFWAKDDLGNYGYRHSSTATAGVSGFVMADREVLNGVVHTRSGVVTVSGTTSPGSKVLLKVADRNATISQTESRNPAFADFTVDVSTGTTFSGSLTIPSASGNGEKAVWGWIWTNPSDPTSASSPRKLTDILIDNTNPTVTVGTELRKRGDHTADGVKQDDTLEFIFSANEALKTIAATITAQTATCQPTETVAGSVNVTCSYTLAQGATEGPAGYTLAVTDYAGNTRNLTGTSSIVVDANAPTVTHTKTPDIGLIAPGGDISVSGTISDVYGIKPGTYTFKLQYGTTDITTCDVVTVAGDTTKNFTCAGTLPTAGPADGNMVKLVIPELRDTAENAFDADDPELYRVDTMAPTLASIESEDSTQKRRFSFSITAVHNQSAANGSSPERVYPVFGGPCADFSVSESVVWSSDTPSDAATETYVSGPISVAKGSYKGCTLQLRDEAGNLSADTLDFADFSIRGSSGGSAGAGVFVGSAPRLPWQTGPVPGAGTTGQVSVAPATSDHHPVVKTIVQVSQTSETPIMESPVVETPLGTGSTGESVRDLQEFLNHVGHAVSESGPGSEGQETEVFGPATERALQEYQESNGLPVTGQYDQQTQEVARRHTYLNVMVYLVQQAVTLQIRIQSLLSGGQ